MMYRTILMSGALAFAAAFATAAFSQSGIPAGTVIPVELNASLSSAKSRVGEKISARVMQDVPLKDGERIRRGAQMTGQVLAVRPSTNGSVARIAFRFDQLTEGKHSHALRTDLRAVASMVDVHDAEIPPMGSDRGTSELDYTTVQVGGDVVYRGGGSVMSGSRIVGEPVANGVLSEVSERPGSDCRGLIEGASQRQALWVFSSDACGAYGLGETIIVHAGRTEPVGEITLESTHGEVKLQSGSGMLLRVN
jgi:hypothetical protein